MEFPGIFVLVTSEYDFSKVKNEYTHCATMTLKEDKDKPEQTFDMYRSKEKRTYPIYESTSETKNDCYIVIFKNKYRYYNEVTIPSLIEKTLDEHRDVFEEGTDEPFKTYHHGHCWTLIRLP